MRSLWCQRLSCSDQSPFSQRPRLKPVPPLWVIKSLFPWPAAVSMEFLPAGFDRAGMASASSWRYMAGCCALALPFVPYHQNALVQIGGDFIKKCQDQSNADVCDFYGIRLIGFLVHCNAATPKITVQSDHAQRRSSDRDQTPSCDHWESD